MLKRGVRMLKRTTLISLALVAGAIVPGLAHAQGNLLQFVQKFKGKFPSEIKDTQAFDNTYVARLSQSFIYPLEYDDANGLLTMGVPLDFLYRRCKKTGEGVGTTVMGARVAFTRQTCDEILLKDSSAYIGNSITAPGTPALFRSVKEKGLEVETVIKPRKGKGPTVEYERVPRPPKIDNPYETTAHFYTIDADVVERRYFVPGIKTPIKIETR